MSSKKDMRRNDLIIGYIEPEADKNPTDMSSTIASSVPMAAIFTRQKMIGWVAVVFAVQTWLQESPEQRKRSPTPGYFTVLMAVMSLFVCYMPLFMPPPPNARSQTGAPAPAPPPH